MWLVLVLILTSSMGQNLIQLGDKELVGEDQQLARLLRQRTSHGGLTLGKMALPKQYHDNARFYNTIKQSLDPSARRNYRFHEPEEREMKMRTVELMQTAIYLTQYRMNHLSEVLKRYTKDIRFRVAFIYCRLDTLLREMRIMFTVQNNSLSAEYQYYDRNVHECLIYYTYFLRKNIDVTYIVEHMIEIHHNFTMKHVKKPVANQTSETPMGPDGLPLPKEPGAGNPPGADRPPDNQKPPQVPPPAN